MAPPSTFRRRKNQVFAAIAAAGGGFSLGVMLGWGLRAKAPLMEEGVPEDMMPWALVLVVALGAVVAMPAVAVFPDRFGWRFTLLAAAVPLILAWILIALAIQVHCHPAMVLIARFVLGFSGGTFSVAVPVYIGEVAEKDIRGALCICNHLLFTLGFLYAYVFGIWGFLDWPAAACLIFFAVLWFSRESPIFLMSKVRREEAIEALKWFRGGSEADIDGEVNEMEQMQNRTGSLWDSFNTRAAKRGLVIGISLQILHQLSGLTIVMQFITNVIASSDYDDKRLIKFCVILAVIQVASALLFTLLVELAGRRLWLMLSLLSMSVCLLVMDLITRFGEGQDWVGWLFQVTRFTYVIAYHLGAGPLPWAMIGEIFPVRIKAIAISICGGISWFLFFIVALTFFYIFDMLDNLLVVNAIICVLATLYVYFYMIETRNKSLTEIQKELEGQS